ncbi:MAG: KpsF/GutQ family sugar-phosphate isomerase [Opitutales bacterium]|nr:KpsF/GutQ family sugar-phosphate isomerase [Opitutales bacterium]MDG1326240.1 KpsF/GutQ family sugar-phosphate isomerase [Opitutales bacterium]
MSEQELKEAVKVLKKESESIERAASLLGKNFSLALDILFKPNNKIIVCGIGKSGLLGKKLAATFCSTGSPASFLHASEAVHGDLGIHQSGDPVIFLSNSASTPELLFLEPIFRKRKAKIVGIMGNTDGPLIKKVDVFLNSTVLGEADPLGIVPTASFMVSASLGDALASGLMKRKKFTKSEYAQTHPAGQLGRNLLFNVHDVMHPLSEIAIVRSSTLISDLVIEMTKHPLGAACVVKDSKLLGIVTDGDLRRSLMKNKNLLNMTAKQIMNANPKTIDPALSLGEALSVMEHGSKQVSVLPVAKLGQDKLMGLLRLHDIYSSEHK